MFEASGEVSHPAKVLTCTVRCVTTCFCLMAAELGSAAAAWGGGLLSGVLLPFADILASEIRSVSIHTYTGLVEQQLFFLVMALSFHAFSVFSPFFFLQNKALVVFRVLKVTSEQQFSVTFITQEITEFKGL